MPFLPPKSLQYCENIDVDVPKMFIDKEIGGDGNVQGGEFLRELLYISDDVKKSKIEVWINSPGGIVTEGQSIYASILASKAPVDTICFGIAASIAGVIFQAGRVRKMYDYATLMYHPAYSDDGKVDKGLEALNRAICVMISSRTGKSEDDIWAIMNRGKATDKGTWIGAQEALELGFCDEIIKSNSKNKNNNNTDVYKYGNIILNRNNNKPKPKQMKAVMNRLGLNEEASEASALAAIEDLKKSYEKKKADLDDFKKKLEDKMKECNDLKKEIDALKDKTKADAEEADKKAKAEEEDKKAKKADEELKNAVSFGKIKNDAKVIETFKNAFLKDFEGTKSLVDAMPATKNSVEFKELDGMVLSYTQAELAAKSVGLTPKDGGKYYNFIKIHELKNR